LNKKLQTNIYRTNHIPAIDSMRTTVFSRPKASACKAYW